MNFIIELKFRALLFSFLICGALAYVLIILYDSQEIDDSIKDHVETEFVSDGHGLRNSIIHSNFSCGRSRETFDPLVSYMSHVT